MNLATPGSVVCFNNPGPNSALHPTEPRPLQAGDEFVVEDANERYVYYTDHLGNYVAVAWHFVDVVQAAPPAPVEPEPVCVCNVAVTGCVCGRMAWERAKGISR